MIKKRKTGSVLNSVYAIAKKYDSGLLWNQKLNRKLNQKVVVRICIVYWSKH